MIPSHAQTSQSPSLWTKEQDYNASSNNGIVLVRHRERNKASRYNGIVPRGLCGNTGVFGSLALGAVMRAVIYQS